MCAVMESWTTPSKLAMTEIPTVLMAAQAIAHLSSLAGPAQQLMAQRVSALPFVEMVKLFLLRPATMETLITLQNANQTAAEVSQDGLAQAGAHLLQALVLRSEETE